MAGLRVLAPPIKVRILVPQINLYRGGFKPAPIVKTHLNRSAKILILSASSFVYLISLSILYSVIVTLNIPGWGGFKPAPTGKRYYHAYKGILLQQASSRFYDKIQNALY
jgi:hypothetical protein